MTEWHADPQVLARYAAGSLAMAAAGSIETHLLTCAECRARVSVHADRAMLDLAWRDTVDRLDRANQPAEGVLRRLGLDEASVRIAGAASDARAAWFAACLCVAVFAAVGSATQGRLTSAILLTVAPLLPVAGVAMAYGPHTEPMYELAAATPYSRPRLVLLRSLAVLPMVAGLLTVGGLTLPGGFAVSALWLLPSIALSAVTLAAEPRLGAVPAAAVVGTAWMSLVVVSAASGESLRAAYGGATQIASLLLIGIAAVLLGRRGWEPMKERWHDKRSDAH